jgi:hypothetical protein
MPRRCKKWWSLSSHRYCRYHVKQDPDAESAAETAAFEPYVSRCKGVSAHGERCRKDWHTSLNGYCDHHQYQARLKTAIDHHASVKIESGADDPSTVEPQDELKRDGIKCEP